GFGFGGGWGGLIGLLIVASLFGGGWGFGGGFGGGGGALNGVLTRADLSSGFSFNNLENAVRGIQQGICDSTYALNNGIMSGFHGVDNALCGIGHQISDCCCTTQNAIQNVRYDLATQACDTRNLIQNVARDITDNANANTRSIMDFLVNDKISTLTAENQALKFAASQASQNAFITANQEAQTAELIRRLGRDCPIPAYVVPNPNCCYGNPVGIGYGNGFGNGCGCGCTA
ncbi:MAG: hypothetical protein IJ466_11780, partial [Clostridia bacterium]|nr:hypothetical protein [Clostridia bacterium]